jgi:hypothetical protein
MKSPWNKMNPSVSVFSALAALSLAAPPTVLAAPATEPNPFTQGTAAVHLSPAQIQSLVQYVNQSKAQLEQALIDAKSLGVEEAARVYLEAVKSVVQASFADRPRSELLMRIILNQALALTYGVPTADGHGIETPGVLSGSRYVDLLPAILRGSIEQALSYVEQDRQAIEAGVLTDLPYAQVAHSRLKSAQVWMRSVLSLDESARFGLAALNQWLSAMMSEDSLHQAKHADAITRVTRALSQAEGMPKLGLSASVVAGRQARRRSRVQDLRAQG